MRLDSMQKQLDKRLATLHTGIDLGFRALHAARIEEMSDMLRAMTTVHAHLAVVEKKR